MIPCLLHVGTVVAVDHVTGHPAWLAFCRARYRVRRSIHDRVVCSPSSGVEYAELSADQRRNLEWMIINQMLASGYWDEYIDEANGSADGTCYQGPPDAAIVPGSDP